MFCAKAKKKNPTRDISDNRPQMYDRKWPLYDPRFRALPLTDVRFAATQTSEVSLTPAVRESLSAAHINCRIPRAALKLHIILQINQFSNSAYAKRSNVNWYTYVMHRIRIFSIWVEVFAYWRQKNN